MHLIVRVYSECFQMKITGVECSVTVYPTISSDVYLPFDCFVFDGQGIFTYINAKWIKNSEIYFWQFTWVHSTRHRLYSNINIEQNAYTHKHNHRFLKTFFKHMVCYMYVQFIQISILNSLLCLPIWWFVVVVFFLNNRNYLSMYYSFIIITCMYFNFRPTHAFCYVLDKWK